jgi:uncharacterized protein YjbI with pentapeptide repeats
MNADELKSVIDAHAKWIMGTGGEMADLSGANLIEADLSWADLRQANLRGADLRGANLCMTILYEADLTGANLQGANFDEAKLGRAKGINHAQCSFSAHGEYSRVLTGVLIDGELMVFCSCFSGTLADLDAFIASGEDKHKRSRKLARDFIVAAINIAMEQTK